MALNLSYSHSKLDVTTTSQTAVAASDGRKWLLLINDSDTDIYINMGGTAVANTGIRLNANGGSLELNPVLGSRYQGAITAIHSGTGDKVLLITEGV